LVEFRAKALLKNWRARQVQKLDVCASTRFGRELEREVEIAFRLVWSRTDGVNERR